MQEKENDFVNKTVRLKESLWWAISCQAKRESRSQANMLRVMAQTYIDNAEKGLHLK